MTRCPPPEVVQAAAAGVLSPALAARVTAHVVDCDICRTLVEALDDPSTGDLTGEERDRILRRVQASRAPAPTTSWPHVWRWAAAAAVFGVMVGSGVRWWSTPTPPSPGAPPALVPDPSPLASALSGRRSETATPAGESNDLTLALAPYRQGDLTKTWQNLADFVGRYPESAPGHFYLGVSSLVLNRDRLAVWALEAAERLAGKDNAPLARQAAWYLAIGYWRTGQFDRARLRLTILCDTPGEFSGRACDASGSLGFVTLSGTVTTAEGHPVAGVTVGQYVPRARGPQMVLTPTSFASTSDAAGKYTIVGVPEVRGSHLVLRASRAGYFTASGGTLLEPEIPEAQVDFQLRPWTIATLDDVVEGPIDAANDYCSNIGEVCRQLAVLAPGSGILDVSLTASEPSQMDVWVETPDGEVHSPAVGAPLRVLSPVMAGATYQITVVSWVPQSPYFKLTMQLR